MIESESNKNLIAKWINNDLDPDTKVAFEKTEEFRLYQQILDATDTLTPPATDMDKMEEILFEKIEQKQKENKKPKTIQLAYWLSGIAAAACVLFGVFWFGNSDLQYTTGYAEQRTITLPDGSEASLNAKSTVSFDEKNWDSNRLLTLDGDAFFNVKKGSKFQVKTTHGTVTVLGTQFNVRTTEKMFQVTCSEGKVRVETKQGTTINLQKGKGFRSLNNEEITWDIDDTNLSLSDEETVCHYLPLQEVLYLLESQFNLVFKNEDVDLTQHYSGVYNNKDVSLALKTIFTPMDVVYELKGKNTIIIRNKK